MRALLLLLLLSPLAVATSHEASISIFLEGTIGVNITGGCIDPVDCSLPSTNYFYTQLGEASGCLVTVENKANIRDVISIQASLPDGDPNEGWVKFSFTCIETVGECNGTEVKNMQIDPDIRNTTVFLSIKGYKVTVGEAPILLRGFSNTNFTVENLGCVRVRVKTKGGVFKPFEAPVFDSPAIMLFAILAASLVYMATQRKSQT